MLENREGGCHCGRVRFRARVDLDLPSRRAQGEMAIDYPAGFGSGEPAMNAFYEHHKDSIRFGYRCFDRILLNGLIQPFQQPERVVGFFSTYRHLHPVSRDILRGAPEQFQLWVKEQADKWNAPIVELLEAVATNLSTPTSGAQDRIR